MDAAAKAILRQADEILVKPMDVDALADVIEERLAGGPHRRRVVETVAVVIEPLSVMTHTRLIRNRARRWIATCGIASGGGFGVDANQSRRAACGTFSDRPAALPQFRH